MFRGRHDRVAHRAAARRAFLSGRHALGARLTYTKAFAALFEGQPEARAELGPLTDKLLPLLDVYRALHKARHKRGALEFDAAEAEFDIDAAGRIQRVVSATSATRRTSSSRSA